MILFWARAVSRGNGWSATKGAWVSVFKTPKKLYQRSKIQKNRKVSADYIWNIMVHDLPPNAQALRKLRNKWWALTGRKYVDSN